MRLAGLPAEALPAGGGEGGGENTRKKNNFWDARKNRIGITEEKLRRDPKMFVVWITLVWNCQRRKRYIVRRIPSVLDKALGSLLPSAGTSYPPFDSLRSLRVPYRLTQKFYPLLA